MHIPRSLSQLTALALGLLVVLPPLTAQALPQKQRAAAVAAPAPLTQEVHPASSYQQVVQHLIALSHDAQTIRTLWARFGTDLLPLLEHGILTEDATAYLLLPNGRTDRLERYLAYSQAVPELTAEEVVLQVNIGLDAPFYEHAVLCAQPDSLTVLVNKYNSLPETYVPELVALGSRYGVGSLRPEAAQAFAAMADAARADGISLRSVSAYRSYSTQTSLYRQYVSQSGQTLADTFSARPGYSEHQTGLALDINVARTSAHFEDTAEFAWLQEHCAQYGFILRYPQGKNDITGYRFEPWHYRYVGQEIAKLCMSQGLTYEEYWAGQATPSQSPALFLQGQELEADTLLLSGSLYLSPAQLCPALGWSVQQRQNQLQLSNESQTLTLVPGRCVLRNGKSLRLSSPALWLGNRLYLTLDDLSALLGLDTISTAQGIELYGPTT